MRIDMKKRNFVARRIYSFCLPVGLGLGLGVVACGGSDSGSPNTGGGAGTSSGGSSSAGSSATAGGTGKAGGSNTGGTNGSAGNSNTAGSNSSSPGDLDTGLPGTKPLSDLTDAEIAGLCNKFDEFYSTGSVGMDLEDFSCRFSGLLAAAFAGAETDAAARAACKATYDSCVAAPAETTSECGKPSGMCTATVAELEACANDSAKALQQLTSSFPTCAELTLADLMDAGGGGDDPPQNPASCTTLEMKCPDGPTPPSPM
jgi:hypothetical protein